MEKVEIMDHLLNEALSLSDNDISKACAFLSGAYLRGTIHKVTDTTEKRIELVKIVMDSIMSFPKLEDM